MVERCREDVVVDGLPADFGLSARDCVRRGSFGLGFSSAAVCGLCGGWAVAGSQLAVVRSAAA
jgi:hypothetical protein